MTAPRSCFVSVRRAVVTILAAVAIASGWSNTASAHTEFESSSPSDQEVVDGPLHEVVVNFTNPATPVGEGFELVDPSGAVRAPSSVDPTDGTSFVLRFQPALTDGSYALRWNVQAGDAHPIEGSFQFDVTGSPAATSTTTAGSGGGTIPASSTPAGPVTAGPGSTGPAVDELLAASSTGDDAVVAGRVGRVVTFVGTIFGVGALAALVWVIRGRRDELHTQLAWIRLAGLVILTGGVIELGALEAAQSVGVAELVDTKAGLAAVLKVIGGAVVCFGLSERSGRVVAPARSLSAAVASELVPARPDEAPNQHRWVPTSSAAIGLAGFALVLASFWFDGHTASKGPWVIHSVVNLVHLGAAAVWGGGVFAMTTVAWLRRRRSERVGLAAMIVRFSTLATVSLSAVVLAGLAMTAFILDTPGDLVATEWGRLLIAKTLAVAVAAGLGAYNHFKLRPALERAPDDPALGRELRVSLTIESIVFGAVVILTAWLVASAT